jgi:UDP-N-acetylglucosamine--N-acetylmuramyl-(pentapeptide) pyrophosphoryl-undecaprenol N-acetylglucosamine transferase
LRSLALSPNLPLLLVFGGSQGARFLNELVPAAVQRLGPNSCERFQLLHLTGQEDNRELLELYRATGLRAAVRTRETGMPEAYLAASLVLSRAGASTLAELALFGKPAILVPLPTAADDHQTANARIAEKNGGAILLPQASLTSDTLSRLLGEWLDDPARFAARGDRIRRIGIPEAAANVVTRIEQAVRARMARPTGNPQ